MSEQIHHLVAFPAEFFEVEEKRKDIQDRNDLKEWEEFYASPEYHKILMGGRYRGSFTDKQKLIDVIKAATDPYAICEGYYEYLLIESYYLNCIDGYVFDPPDHKESEMWFKFVEIGENQYEYQQIERPKVLQGTVGFL